MHETDVVTVFLRHASDLLLLRRSDEVGSYPGRWGAVAGHAEGDPDAAAHEEIAGETGLDPSQEVTLVRRGEPFQVTDEAVGTRWTVHPFLYETATRDIDTNWETAAAEWVRPPAILRRGTVPGLWNSYYRVRPTVDAIASDREHGSAWLSYRALEVLRDEAALGTTDRSTAPGPAALRATGRALVDARHDMPVLRNRIDRAMRVAGIEDPAEQPVPAAVEDATEAGLDRARSADRAAAAHAADRIEGARVATLSRSGTVSDALATGDPEAVLVAESRPGGEGVAVAEDLAAGDLPVTLTGDAALPGELRRWDADVLLVGADAVLPGGHVVNKVGTRGAALAATHDGIEVFVAAATDKLDTAVESPDAVDRGEGVMGTLYVGSAPLSVANPTFDVTPSAVVDGIATERGVLPTGEIGSLAAEHRARAGWRRPD